jgi:hypothetical protein
LYISIPGNLIITKIAFFKCSPNAIYRHFSEEENWGEWFPADRPGFHSVSPATNPSYNYNGDRYLVTKKFQNTIEILISRDSSAINSTVSILQLPTDSVAVYWKCSLAAGLNPFRRVMQYQRARNIKNSMTEILDHLHSFLEKKENVYGMDIRITSTKDTLLIATKYTRPVYPSMAEVYQFIALLKEYIDSQGAAETAPPMLNVTPLDHNQFQIMVAIPINRELPGKGNIFPKRLVPGNFAVSEITGGLYTINKALYQMQLFFEDNGKTSIAIPFQSMVTDRTREQDTTKWVTKIYAPVVR